MFEVLGVKLHITLQDGGSALVSHRARHPGELLELFGLKLWADGDLLFGTFRGMTPSLFVLLL